MIIKQIQKLEKAFGGTDRAAKELGITAYHLRRVKRTGHASPTLQILIRRICRDIREAA
jgi:hypothetical protein